MNSNQDKYQQTNLQPSDQKIKLNQLSKYIFQKVYEQKQINDIDLMKYLSNQIGYNKSQTLKRRKYDAINILEKADIIQVIKNGSSFIYTMKHDVPNSIKDLEKIKEKKNNLENLIQQKKNKLRMMKIAENNYRRLIQLNGVRKKNQEQSIQLPLVAADKKFMELSTDLCSQTQNIKMKFPAGTKFISNVLAHGQIFNF